MTDVPFMKRFAPKHGNKFSVQCFCDQGITNHA